jgi:hypothetical protein
VWTAPIERRPGAPPSLGAWMKADAVTPERLDEQPAEPVLVTGAGRPCAGPYHRAVPTKAEQARTLPLEFVDRYAVRSGRDIYALRLDAGDLVLLRNWRRVASLSQRVSSASVRGGVIAFMLGEAAAETFGDASPETLFTALVIAAAAGHPDEAAGGGLRVIWSPHLAAVTGTNPDLARTKTRIKERSRRLKSFWQDGIELVDRAAAYRETRRLPDEAPAPLVPGTRRPVTGAAAKPEGYSYVRPEALIEAEQRELTLVAGFRADLVARGFRHVQERVWTGTTWITYDLRDTTRHILFEAKADAADRDQIRMAIGQLLDYAYFGFENRGGSIHKALLLPAAPPAEIDELLGFAEIGVAYEQADGSFREAFPWETAGGNAA